MAAAEIDPIIDKRHKRHKVIEFIDSLVDGDNPQSIFTTITPSDPFLDALTFTSTQTSILDSSPASFPPGVVSGTAPSPTMTTNVITGGVTQTIFTGTSDEGLSGTFTVPTGTEGSFQSIITATGAPDGTPNTLLTFPSNTATSPSSSPTTPTSPTSSPKSLSSSSTTPTYAQSHTPTPTQSPNTLTPSHSGISTAALAIAIVLPIVALIIIAFVGYCLVRRRRRQRISENEAAFGPETTEQKSGPSPYLFPLAKAVDRASKRISRAPQIPWPLGISQQEHEPRVVEENKPTARQSTQQQAQMQSHARHGSRPSLAHSNPFTDSRTPSHTSQDWGQTHSHSHTYNNSSSNNNTNNNPRASTIGAAFSTSERIEASSPPHKAPDAPPQRLSIPKTRSRPSTARSPGADDDAVSQVSALSDDAEVQKAEVGVAHRASVIKMSAMMGGGPSPRTSK